MTSHCAGTESGIRCARSTVAVFGEYSRWKSTKISIKASYR